MSASWNFYILRAKLADAAVSPTPREQNWPLSSQDSGSSAPEGRWRLTKGPVPCKERIPALPSVD